MINSYDSERAFIGCLMNMAAAKPINELYRYVARVEDSDFQEPSCSIIYRAIKQLVLADQPFDVLSLYDKIERIDPNTQIRYTEVGQIEAEQSGFAAVESHLAKLLDCSMRRQALQQMDQLREKLLHGEDISQAIGYTESAMSVLLGKASGDDTGLKHIAEILPEWIDAAQDANNGTPTEKGYTTGFEAADLMLGDDLIKPKSVVVIGANPGKGKTSMMIAMSTAIARQYKDRQVHIYSLEMPSLQIVNKLMLQAVHNKAPKHFQDSDWGKIGMQIETFKSSQILISDKSSMTIEQIKSNARAEIAKGNRVGAIFIDYLTMMKMPKADRRDLAVGAVAYACKALAKELGCIVVLLCQLSRENEKRVNKRPVNSDLRDSGEIEQSADYILFPYYDYLFNKESDCGPFAECIWSKNRHGATGTNYAKVTNGVWEDCDQNEAMARISA